MALVVHAEVIVRTKLLVSKVKGFISGNLFMEISMVKVCVPIRSPWEVGLIWMLALVPVYVQAMGEVESTVAPAPPGLVSPSTVALGVVMEYFKGRQLATVGTKWRNSLF